MSDPPEIHRFDELAKAVATASTSRRGFITRLTAGIAGAAVALVGGAGAAVAAARCSPVGHACLRNQDCCSGFCDTTHHPARCATPQTPAPRRPPPPPIGA